MDKKFEQKLPIGLAQELEKQKETAEAVKVKNEVYWVNQEIEFPFKLEEGKECDLALMIDFFKKAEKTYPLETHVSHGRTGILGRVIFRDKQGRLYRDIDLKGIGLKGGPPFEDPGRTAPEGLADLSDILEDKRMAEEFLEKGIRTYRYNAIIKLKEILGKEGLPISIEEAKKQGLIYKEREPVIGIRDWGTRMRIEDTYQRVYYGSPEVEDAKKLVTQEFGFDSKKFTTKSYLEWFAKTLGTQVGLIHRNGWYHEYLSRHNITLDCRIVDLDSVKKLPRDPIKREKRRSDDFNSASWRLINFLEFLNKKYLKGILKKLFEESYQKALEEK